MADGNGSNGADGSNQPVRTPSARRGRAIGRRRHRQAVREGRRHERRSRERRSSRTTSRFRECCMRSSSARPKRTRGSCRSIRRRRSRSTGVRAIILGKDLPIPFGILPVQSGRAHALPRSGSIHWRSGRGGRGRRRGDGGSRLSSRSRSTTRTARDDRFRRRGARRPPSRASTTTARRGTSTSAWTSSSATSTRASPHPTTSSRTCSSSRATRTCRSSSTRRWREWRSRREDHAVELDANAALPASGAREGARAAAVAHPRRRDRRTAAASAEERPLQPRDRGRQARHDDRPSGQDLPDARGGLLLPPRPPSGPDAVQDRRRRRDGRINAMHSQTLLDGGAYGVYGVASHVLHRRAADGDLRRRRATIRRASAASRTRRPAARSAATARRSRGSAWRSRSTRSPKRSARSGRDAADISSRPNSLTANWLRVGSMGLGRASTRSSRDPDWNANVTASCPHGKGVGLACCRTSRGAGLPIYWNDMPHSGVQLKLDRGGGVAVFCGATEIGQGSDSRAWRTSSRRCWASTRRHSGGAPADTDLTPVDLGSYSSRVTLDDGQRGHRGGRASARN